MANELYLTDVIDPRLAVHAAQPCTSAPATAILQIHMQGKPVRESYSEYSELALPNDANSLGNLLGGKVMHLVDLAAAMAAMRHSRQIVVTASVDHMTFLHPVKMGQWVRLHSAVNRVFRTSMEVGVRVMVEDLIAGEIRHTSSAYLTFVAIDRDGNRVPVAPVIPETETEQRRYQEAGTRREYRLALKEKVLHLP